MEEKLCWNNATDSKNIYCTDYQPNSNGQCNCLYTKEVHEQRKIYNFINNFEHVCICGKLQFLSQYPAEKYSGFPKKFFVLGNYSSFGINEVSKKWKIKTLPFILSIIGSTKANIYSSKESIEKVFLNNRKVVSNFKRGIKKIVAKEDICILTDGLDRGITQILSEALYKTQFFTWQRHSGLAIIGIVPWNITKNHVHIEEIFHLSKSKERESFCYLYDFFGSSVGTSAQSCESELSVIHTHFICVDTLRYGADYKNSSDLRSYRSMIETELENSIDSRLITVLVEGELFWLSNITNNLQNRRPVILCEGTGGLADLLIQVLQNKEMRGSNASQIASGLKKNMFNIFEFTPDVGFDIQTFSNKLVEFLQHQYLVVVADLRKTTDLDRAVIDAYTLYKSELRPELVSQIQRLILSVKWNRIDQFTTTIGQMSESLSTIADLREVLIEIVAFGKTDFFEVIMKSGLNIKKLLTTTVLLEIYKRYLPSDTPIRWLLIRLNKLRHFKENFRDDDVVQASLTLQHISKAIEYLVNHHLEGKYDLVDQDEEFEDPFTELFLHSLLFLRFEQALYYWRQSTSPLVNLSIGVVINKSWNAFIWKGLSALKNKVNCSMRNFESIAVDFLNIAEKLHPKLCETALGTPYFRWKNRSPISLAVTAEATNLISCDAVLNSLKLRWKGHIQSSSKRILLCLLCPPLISSIVFDINEKFIIELEKTRETSLFRKKKLHAIKRFAHGNYVGLRATLSKKVQVINGKDEVDSVTEDEVVDDSRMFQIYHSMNFLEKCHFLYSAPVTKFQIDLVSYVIFLLIYSLFVVVVSPGKFNENDNDRKFWMYFEFITLFWLIMYILDEVRQLVTKRVRKGSIIRKLKWFFSSEWNIVDCLMLGFGCVGFVLRFPLSVNESQTTTWMFTISRFFFAVSINFAWIRIIRFTQATVGLGMLWFMIKGMISQLNTFLTILFIFVIGYGVADYSLVFADGRFRWRMFYDFIYQPYHKLYGELFFDQNESTPVESLCSGRSCVVYIGNKLFLAAFLLMGNVLLLNLLIAIFGSVYSDIQSNSKKLWRNEFAVLINEYHTRPLLPAPVNLPSLLIIFTKMGYKMLKKLCRTKIKKREPYRPNERIEVFEEHVLYLYNKTNATDWRNFEKDQWLDELIIQNEDS